MTSPTASPGPSPGPPTSTSTSWSSARSPRPPPTRSPATAPEGLWTTVRPLPGTGLPSRQGPHRRTAWVRAARQLSAGADGEQLGGGALPAAEGALHEAGPGAGGVLAGEVEGADGAGQEVGVGRVEGRGAGGVGGPDPGVVVPGGQDGPAVKVQVGAEGGQAAAPGRRAGGDPEGGQAGAEPAKALTTGWTAPSAPRAVQVQ